MLVAALLSAECGAAEELKAGKLTVVRGAVTIKRTGAGGSSGARVGDDIHVGVLLHTEKDSGAQLTFEDGSFVNLAPSTSLRVNQFIYEPADNKRKAIIKISEGRTRFLIPRRIGGPAFAVETGNACISANTGDFIIEASPAGTEVAVLQNSVRVRNLDYLTVGEILLGINQKTTVKERNQPLKPSILSVEQRRNYIKGTTP